MSDETSASKPVRRKRASHHEEEHENHERWLISYADMVTLLMVLFIVLFALSQVDLDKYNALRSGLSTTLTGQSPTLLDGSESILAEPGASPITPISPITGASDPELRRAIDEALRNEDRRRAIEQYEEVLKKVDELIALQSQVTDKLTAGDLNEDVETAVTEDGLRISLVSRNVIFDANQASLTARGQAVVASLAPILAELPNNLRIEGHTNQAAGKPLFFASDWDLSAARAITVLRLLNERFAIPAERLSALGYGKTRPLLPITDPLSQEVNKRVDIIVRTDLGSPTAALVRRAVAERDRAAELAETLE